MTSTAVATIPREEFVSEYWDYQAGEHVVFGGPTQRGKTTLAFELLGECATEDCPAYVAVSKPRDPTTSKYQQLYGFRRVNNWPPPVQLQNVWAGKPRGFVIWPRFGNMDTDTEHVADVTSRLIRERYTAGLKNKRGILVMDDTVVKARVLGLDKEMVTILTMAGAMGLGMWVFVQKPTDAGRTAIWAYGASEHVFLARDPDARSRQRYDEIGGVDPKLVASTVKGLGPYQFLYIKRTGSYMCVVDK